MPPRLSVLLVPATLALAACDNEVDLLSREAPLPVVYGVLNASDSVQTLSLTKTFVFPAGAGALESASEPDSVYYTAEEVAVVVENERNSRRVIAERVAGVELGRVRAAGDFAASPNIAYRYSTRMLGLQSGDVLSVVVEGDSEVLATARADVLPELSFLQARPPAARITFSGENPSYALSWQRGEVGADELAVYELGFVIAFTERDASGSVRVEQLYWPAATELTADVDAATISVAGFYDFLAANLAADASLSRTLRYVQLVITGGDEDFAAYADLLRANAGITATQQLPPFSNVEGGLGLYAGITQLRQDTFGTLTPDSYDELTRGERTRGLNFE